MFTHVELRLVTQTRLAPLYLWTLWHYTNAVIIIIVTGHLLLPVLNMLPASLRVGDNCALCSRLLRAHLFD